MEPEELDEFKRALSTDLITQKEMAAHLIFQDVEYPRRTSLLERFRKGALIEPGPLTIVQPYFDLGPFIVPATEAIARSQQIRQRIYEAHLALADIDGEDSAAEFRRVSQQIAAMVRQAVEERRKASMNARNWDGFKLYVRDNLYAYEVIWMLWAATQCVGHGLRSLGTRVFGFASERAIALGTV